MVLLLAVVVPVVAAVVLAVVVVLVAVLLLVVVLLLAAAIECSRRSWWCRRRWWCWWRRFCLCWWLLLLLAAVAEMVVVVVVVLLVCCNRRTCTARAAGSSAGLENYLGTHLGTPKTPPKPTPQPSPYPGKGRAPPEGRASRGCIRRLQGTPRRLVVAFVRGCRCPCPKQATFTYIKKRGRKIYIHIFLLGCFMFPYFFLAGPPEKICIHKDWGRKNMYTYFLPGIFYVSAKLLILSLNIWVTALGKLSPIFFRDFF